VEAWLLGLDNSYPLTLGGAFTQQVNRIIANGQRPEAEFRAGFIAKMETNPYPKAPKAMLSLALLKCS